MMNLDDLGWNDAWENRFVEYRQAGLLPLRIMNQQKNYYLAAGETGTVSAEVTGRFINRAQGRGEYPAVGDWVAAAAVPGEGKAMINAVLPRVSIFSRKATTSGGRKIGTFEGAVMVLGGATEEQIIAANIDTVFLVVGLDNNFNLRRIERYLTMAWNTGAVPVILLNKADLRDDLQDILEKVEEISIGVDVHMVSATENYGLESFSRYIDTGRTLAFIGSSGVGKSTLINRLLGYDRQKVQHISETVGKGLHTTTSREMILIPGGGILIDTPGMREIQLWGDEDDVNHSYTDIEELTRRCRFGNCRHRTEPGCAILEALESGDLSRERYDAYNKMMRELHYLEMRQRQKERRRNRRTRD